MPYIGEKVPWLIIHQLLPLIFVAVYMMTKKKMVIALITCIFLIVMTWHVAFIPADVNEPIVQVQNSEDIRTIDKNYRCVRYRYDRIKGLLAASMVLSRAWLG